MAIMGMMVVLIMPLFDGFERQVIQFVLTLVALIGGAVLLYGSIKQESHSDA